MSVPKPDDAATSQSGIIHVATSAVDRRGLSSILTTRAVGHPSHTQAMGDLPAGATEVPSYLASTMTSAHRSRSFICLVGEVHHGCASTGSHLRSSHLSGRGHVGPRGAASPDFVRRLLAAPCRST